MDKIAVKLPFNKTIYQTKKGHSISTDTEFIVITILSEIKKQATKMKVLELGSGNGIISIMLSHYRTNWEMTGLEIQSHLVKLACENSKLAKVKVNFVQGDLCKKEFAPNSFDLIISNPPYYPKNKGKVSPSEERAISRTEIMCTMQDIFKSIKYHLKRNGIAFVIYPVSRIDEILINTKKVDLNIQRKIISNKIKKQEKAIVELIHKKND
ncbi:MAG: methyltransferase [Armatimonadetes bacterium]|nr:methyltransferase [Armatimonadota bacterium]